MRRYTNIGLKRKEGPRSKKCENPLEVKKSKAVDILLESHSLQLQLNKTHIVFLIYWNIKQSILLLSCQVCGKLIRNRNQKSHVPNQQNLQNHKASQSPGNPHTLKLEDTLIDQMRKTVHIEGKCSRKGSLLLTQDQNPRSLSRRFVLGIVCLQASFTNKEF